MIHEGILSRMGRLIAGVTYATIEKAEGVNGVAIVEQAIREIDSAAEEARAELGKARAEEHRIASRRAPSRPTASLTSSRTMPATSRSAGPRTASRTNHE